MSMLALATDAFGGKGGIAQYNRDFFGALAASGSLSSIVVVPRHADDAPDVPAGIEQRPPRAGRLSYVLAALRETLARPCDVVFCGHLYMAPLALLLARLRRAKLVIQMHGIEAWQRPSTLRRQAVEAADLVLCVSRHTRAAVLGWASIVPERVIVVPDTVSDTFTPGDGSALRTAWGLQGKKVLLTVGRTSAAERYKGHDRVIQALPRLVAQGHDAVYVVLGDGDDRERLAALAAREGVADRARFMGAVNFETLANAYRMADVFVMPSTGEGFGIVFLEAMASGTPVIGLAVAGASDALADGELGVATTEAEFCIELEGALSRPKPDAKALAAALKRRFGYNQFRTRAAVALNRLMEPA